ncbi:MAG: DUF2892 domain-containing protein [Paludibacteraceae bacterium]
MKTNIGSLDKVVRLLIATVLIILFYANILTKILGVVSLIVALLLTISSFTGFSPLYLLFKINTLSKKRRSKL